MRLKIVGKNPRQVEKVKNTLSFLDASRLKLVLKNPAFGLQVLSIAGDLIVVDTRNVQMSNLMPFVRNAK